MNDSGEYEYEDADAPAGTGLLGRTIRNVGLLVVVGLLIATVMRVDETEDSANPALNASAERQETPAVRLAAAPLGENELVIPAGGNGHFLVQGEANGVDIRFLVDTGASTVVLGAAQAERLGIDEDTLDFDGRLQTANGVIPGARVILRDIRVGDLELQDVAATVIRAEVPVALLGMSVLGRLRGYEVEENRLILRW